MKWTWWVSYTWTKIWKNNGKLITLVVDIYENYIAADVIISSLFSGTVNIGDCYYYYYNNNYY
jgi:hypothetical protein